MSAVLIGPTPEALTADGRTVALGSRDGRVRLLPAEMVWAG